MYCVKHIKDDPFWVGGTDRRLALFENTFPIPRGISYSAYLPLDEKTVLLDTVDRTVAEQFFENIDTLLKGQNLDYVVMNHMEPNCCTTLSEIVRRYPEVQVIYNAKTIPIIEQFYSFDIDSRAVIVKENDTLNTGKHTFTFIVAPMVHQPEVMVTYDITDKIPFSADALDTFGAMNGSIFADKINFERDWLDNARRHYTNIVGKYDPSVQTLLKKASALEIHTLCPLHGPVWRADVEWYVNKYLTWGGCAPEEKAVVIAYGSIYGDTESVAGILTGMLADRGVRNITMYDASSTHPSTMISEAFRCSHLVIASVTHGGGISSNIEHFLMGLGTHNLQNRTVIIMENGSWGVLSRKQMREIIGSMKNMTIMEQSITVESSLKDIQMAELEAMADTIVESVKQTVIAH